MGMTGFGARLAKQRVAAWAVSYVDYEALKRCLEDAEVDFERRFRKEVDKAHLFGCARLGRCAEALRVAAGDGERPRRAPVRV